MHARARCWAAAHSNESALMQGTEPEECVVPQSRHGRKGQHCGGKGGGGGQEEEESSVLVGGSLLAAQKTTRRRMQVSVIEKSSGTRGEGTAGL